MPAIKRLGFIGLGKMGTPMATSLVRAGYKLFVCDSNPDAASQLAREGAEVLETPLQLGQVKGLRAVFSMLPSPTQVKEAYVGPYGLLSLGDLQTLQPPLLVDCSTVDPGTSRDLAAAAASTALHPDPADAFSRRYPLMIDAPVSGGVPAAKAATLTFMCGGAANAVEEAESFLLSMGRRVVHCGWHGSGEAAKLANNLVLAISMAAVAEGLAFGKRQGLCPEVLTKIFNISSAQCWSSEKYNPVPGVQEGVPSARAYQGGFSTALMLKDLRLALDAAAGCDARLPMTGKASELYQQVAEMTGSGLDFSAIYQYIYNSEH